MIEQIHLDLPKEYVAQIEGDLTAFGEKVATTLYDLHMEAERQPPRVDHFDSWGKRVDKLITSDAWKQLKRVSATEGVISIAYERKYEQYSRLYQILKLYMFSPSSGMYTCPLAMTDGAARTLESLGMNNPLAREAYTRLTSRDPNKFWTSGQFLEKN